MKECSKCTYTVTGNTLLAAVTVMQVVNTTCSQWPWRTQSSEFQAAGRVNVIFISSWDSLPLREREGKLGFVHTSIWATIARIRTRGKRLRQQPSAWTRTFEVIQDLHYQQREHTKKVKNQTQPNYTTKAPGAGPSNLSCPQEWGD